MVQVIPDIRERTEVELVGTPLTHSRFLRRHQGTYGPAISARSSSFPGSGTPIPGLYGCGDSYMPGIGVPAAAASGMIVANTLVSVPKHLDLLRGLYSKQ
jgi:phytoene dehydrogenase-like protein